MNATLSKIYNNALEYFNSSDWHQIIFRLKVISVILSIFFIISIFALLFKIRKSIKEGLLTITENGSASDSSFKKETDEKWQAVLDKLDKNNESDYKLAIIEADKIFDDLLKRLGYIGDDMGERLKQISSVQLANIDDVWQAHKARNRIAHEPGFKIKRSEAEQVVKIYQRAMKNLEVL